MSNKSADSWRRFEQYYFEFPRLGLSLDVSQMRFAEGFLAKMKVPMARALREMRQLEKGAIANADENRRVGHYWLRSPSLAPKDGTGVQIQKTLQAIKRFSTNVHAGRIRGQRGKFKRLLLIGIGGSALGPQFVSHALGRPGEDQLAFSCLDNTDPDGIQRVIKSIRTELGQTLVIVISKSGGTKETRNGMLEAKAAYAATGLAFEKHAVAITQDGSALDQLAKKDRWIRRFPMWDWVGGRTSVMSAVGLLPAALQGFNVDELLAGARECDAVTRSGNLRANPSALLALMWFYAGNGKGKKDMVILPYKDRLEPLSRYLQQLIMESLGKALDRSGRRVEQGIAVYGNKGSTDQHAFVQQLRDGINNFFVTFIEVWKAQDGRPLSVEPGITSNDYLMGFLLGTRRALAENGRESITITIRDVSAFSLGVLIAMFERAVGLYASLINVNAYNQPGVEAGKKAAGDVLALQLKIIDALRRASPEPCSIGQLAKKIGSPDAVETVFKLCAYLSSNPGRGIEETKGLSKLISGRSFRFNH